MDYADSCTSRNCTDRTTSYEDRLGVEYYGTIMLSVIPVPAAVWLFGSGLIGLIGSVKKESESLILTKQYAIQPRRRAGFYSPDSLSVAGTAISQFK